MILPYRKHIIKNNLKRYKNYIKDLKRIDLYNVVNSTNVLLKDRAIHGAGEGEIIIAYEQTSGKGRMGRSFYSPCGTGIYISILLRPEINASDSFLITTSAAVAVARAIENMGSAKAGIKWVNDIFINGKKVGGILAEGVQSPDSEYLDFSILGIGINIFPPKNGFPDDLKDIASSVFENDLGKSKYIREEIAADIIGEFFKIYNSLPSKEFMEEYISRSILVGKEVTITYGNSELCGKVTGIDYNGCICVKDKNGETKKFSFGEARAKLI